MADFKYDPFSYADYSKSAEVIEAEKRKANAESAVANYGDFTFSKQGDWDSIYNKYNNRGDFTYDFNADALYQQYKDRYIQQGKMAMADAMGQASAMTGGYGNSYAATVGNQAYQSHLDKLNDVIPELYQLAYDRYNQEGQDMLNMLSLLGSERNFEYGTWGDKLNKLTTDRNYYSSEASDAYNRDYGEWSDNRTFEYGKWSDDRDLAYSEHRNSIADEQWAKNYLLQENADKRAQEKWDLEKAAYELANSQGSGSTSGGSGQSGNIETNPNVEGAKSLINGIVATGAVAKGKTVDKNTASGQREITSAINKEINDAVKAGAISADEARKLKKELNPRGYTK